MSVQVHVGAFQLSTAAAASTQAITGLGFTPKAVLFFVDGQAVAVTTADVNTVDMRGCWGMACGAADQRCWAGSSNNGVIPTVTAAGHRTDNCLGTIDPSGLAWEGLIGVQSFDADGFTLVVNQQFASAYTCFYWAIGGADITAKSVTKARAGLGGSGGNVSYTGIGFSPDFVFMIGGHIGLTTTTGIAACNATGIGIACAKSTQQWYNYSVDQNASTPLTNAKNYEDQQHCFLFQNGTNSIGVSSQGTFVGSTSDGFVLNWLGGGTTTAPILALCIQGGQWAANAFMISHTNGAQESVAGYFPPVGAMFQTGGNTANGGLTPFGTFEQVWGAFDNGFSQFGMCWKSGPNQTPSKMALGVNFTDCMYRVELGGAGSVGINANLTSLDPSGFTLTTKTGTAVSDQWTYWFMVGNQGVPIADDSDFHCIVSADY